MEQTELLARIKQSLHRALLPQAQAEHPGPFSGNALQAGIPASKLVEQFKLELEALSGHVHLADNAADIPGLILEILRRHRANRILAWDAPHLGLPGLEAGLTAAGISLDTGNLPADPAERRSRLVDLEKITVGLTGAEAGLADTGSLALVSGPGRSRLASLLPPVHIALLPLARLYPSLAAFLAAQPDAVAAGSNLVLITGPSRTADIEMTLTIGVHGPAEVHAIIFGDPQHG